MSRPWWMPEGVDPSVVSWAFGDEVGFLYRVVPEGVKVEGPVCLWNRTLSNDEIGLARAALMTGNIAAIYTLDPDHVRYQGDVDEDGTCRCVVCRGRP